MPKLLLIEDNEEILYANRTMLELEGYTVFPTGTVEAGGKAAAEVKPDIILTDIFLPDGNGMELCRSLRQKMDFKVLFLSEMCTDQKLLDGISREGYDYLKKPYLMDDLIKKVRDMLKEC